MIFICELNSRQKIITLELLLIKTTRIMSAYKTIPGMDATGDPKNPYVAKDIKFKIQTNNEVHGYGRPITMKLCRYIIGEYYKLQQSISKTIQSIKSSDPLVNELKIKVDPENEIVSGIYGRDTLMHILEQKGCEGIQYVNCIYNNEKSIVLFGVDGDGHPIGDEKSFQTDSLDTNLVLYEVKGGSKSMKEINKMISSQDPANNEIESFFKALFAK